MSIKYIELTDGYFDPEKGDECTDIFNSYKFVKVDWKGLISDFQHSFNLCQIKFRRPIKIDRSETDLKNANWQ